MKNSNKILILSLFLILFMSVSAISAAENNANVTADASHDGILKVEAKDNLQDDSKGSSNVLTTAKEDVMSDKASMSFNDLYDKLIPQQQKNVVLTSDVIYESGDITTGIPINQFDEITIDGKGHTIDAKGKARVFIVPTGHTFILKNVNIKNAYVSGDVGGAIKNSGTIKLTNCNFTNCKAAGSKGSGGAIAGGGAGNIKNCNFINCEASYMGGAANVDKVQFHYCNFNGCTAGCGGAIAGTVYLYDSNFKNCKSTKTKSAFSATDGGGACTGEFPRVERCQFTNCKATNGGLGGALRGTSNVYDSKFVNCAAKQGGAIRGKGVTSGCTFEKCVATTGMGGALFTEKATITKCKFNECTASKSNAGAVYLGNNVKMTSCKFTKCSAPNGCGGAIYGNGVASKCTFEGNKAKFGGAASSYSLTVKSSTFISNSAGKGGAAYNIKALTSCKLNKNTATYGGAVFNAQNVVSCKFGNNKAKYGALSYNNVNVVFKKAGIKNTLKLTQGLFYNNKHKLTLTASKIINTGKYNKYFNYNTGVFIYNKNTLQSSVKVKQIAGPRNAQKK